MIVSVILTTCLLESLFKFHIQRSQVPLLFTSIITISLSIDDKTSFLAQISLSPPHYRLFDLLGTLFGCRVISLSLCTILFVPILLCRKQLLCIVFVRRGSVINMRDTRWPIVVDPKWPIADPRNLSQYVYDSESNASHLPAVNNRVQRWIQVHESQWEKKKFL